MLEKALILKFAFADECRQFVGQSHPHGSIFSPKPCTECQCNNGHLNCTTQDPAKGNFNHCAWKPCKKSHYFVSHSRKFCNSKKMVTIFRLSPTGLPAGRANSRRGKMLPNLPKRLLLAWSRLSPRIGCLCQWTLELHLPLSWGLQRKRNDLRRYFDRKHETINIFDLFLSLFFHSQITMNVNSWEGKVGTFALKPTQFVSIPSDPIDVS